VNSRDLSDLELARHLAGLSDEISMARFQAIDLRVETKPDLTPVSDADQAIEEMIRNELSTARPHDQIVGEEFGSGDRSGRHWVVDPIDGTKNFVRGVPVWATLIALMDGEEVIAGVVSAPALCRRWYASKGSGAYLELTRSSGVPAGNKPQSQSQHVRRLQVSAVSQIADASLSISSFASPTTGNRNDGWGALHPNLLTLAESVWRTRAYGDFWSHMLVAEGAIDCALEPQLALWDMAALAIILTEAGGRFTDFRGIDGPNGGNAISSNGLLHNSLLEFFPTL
jgi:histidinol-phosphatase